jgi:hypothetical protein
MKDPRRTKLMEYRAGTSNIRRERAKWKRWDRAGLRHNLGPRLIEELDAEGVGEGSEDLQPYSETGVVIETTGGGAVSCCIKEA